MNETTIVETLPATVPAQSMAVARPDSAMGVTDILAQVRLIQEVMGKVMHDGEHYGKIPGCGDKKTLLQPGAQKLCMTFRLAPSYQIQETNFDRGHKEYRVICTLKSIASGNIVGEGVGCCSTLESKYRWKGGQRKCPQCGKEAIIKGKAEYGGGWLCFGKKGGCGQKWPDGAREIEGQNVDKVEHDSPADFFNTVLKMAKKRAFVDATITATAASDIFTQDVGDAEGDDTPEQPPKRPQDAPQAPKAQSSDRSQKTPATPKSAPASPAAAATPKKAKQADWLPFLTACKAKLVSLVPQDDEWMWWRYAVDMGWILPSSESLADANPERIFEGFDKANYRDSVSAIVKKHTAEVQARIEHCPPEMRDELKRGLVRMPRGKTSPPAPTPKEFCAPPPAMVDRPGVCPACRSSATQDHDDLVGVKWCQTCGVAWQATDPNKEPFEEHPWMFARLPFAPKDADKKAFKGMTLGQISRLDHRYWFGIVMNFEAKPFNGRPPSKESVEFGKACEEARAYLDERASQGRASQARSDASNEPVDPLDDVPFNSLPLRRVQKQLLGLQRLSWLTFQKLA